MMTGRCIIAFVIRHIGRALMYELLSSEQIESLHVGRLHKIPASALATFVERCRRDT